MIAGEIDLWTAGRSPIWSRSKGDAIEMVG